jgi:uncharacterized protein YjbI with pentapeptide repeats
VNKEADVRHSSSAHPPLLHCEQRSLRQRKVAGLAYDSEHGKLWQDIKADLDETRARASKFAADAEWAFGRRTARVVGVVMLFIVVVALLLVFLDWYIAPTKPGDKKDLVLSMAQILAGTALLSGLYFTWRTLQVNREAQITERFTRAIDQLGKVDDKGHKLFEIRLGGIYALERIARESKEDYWPIMEVLTAYVRQNSPSRPLEGQQGEEDAIIEKFETGSGGSKKKSAPTDVHATDSDIQAIMTVLRRRSRSFGHGEPKRLDLSETDLTGADLTEANLTRANLSGAILQDSLLTEADLSGADLSGANLPGVNLSKANLSGADLSGANLSGAILTEGPIPGATLTEADFEEEDWRLLQEFLEEGELEEEGLEEEDPEAGDWGFTEANLTEANLTEADLSGADLSGANLPGVNLSGAILMGADLSKANLSGAILMGADLTEANLSGADLSGADLRKEDTTAILAEATLTGVELRGADLTEGNFSSANLTGAILFGANFRGANLSGANLSGAYLTRLILSQAQLERTIGDGNTQLPPDLKPPAHWNVKTD